MRARVPRTPDPEQARHAGVIQQRRHWRDGDSLTLEASPGAQRSAVHDVLRDSGQPLDRGLRTEMEARLGGDFSHVRVHADPAARASAAVIGARAYTSGNHIVLGQGGENKHILAHELTHVLQQRQGPVAGTDYSGIKVSDPSDADERAAEATARRVMSGARRRDQDSNRFGRGRPANAASSAPAVLTIQRGGVLSRVSDRQSPPTLTLSGPQRGQVSGRGIVEALIVTEATLSDANERVKYEIRWSNNDAAPSGNHLAPGGGSNADLGANTWHLDRDPHGHDIGDRGNSQHHYFNEQDEHVTNGKKWSFRDHIVQEDRFGPGAWWEFRLRVVDEQGRELRQSNVVRITWPARESE